MLIAILALSVGTYGFRLAGPVLRDRVRVPARMQRLLVMGATVLLSAFVAISALTQGHGFAGWARVVGVLVGGVLAWRRVPLIVVVVVAAAVCALLRLVGVA
ncbi:MAG: AzlD domain-containing protein [Sciscionella sp.]